MLVRKVIVWSLLGLAQPLLSLSAVFSPTGSNQSITAQSTIEGALDASRPAFEQLVRMAAQNHIPLGVIVGPKENESLCKPFMSADFHFTSIGELVSILNSALPGYKADVSDGVLTVRPATLTPNASQLLSLDIDNFHSEGGAHNIAASDLWMYIRFKVAPSEPSYSGGFSSTQAETVRVTIKGKSTVSSLLDDIVKAGDGGLWVFYEAGLQSINSQRSRPYVVYGYRNQEELIVTKLQCLTKPMANAGGTEKSSKRITSAY